MAFDGTNMLVGPLQTHSHARPQRRSVLPHASCLFFVLLANHANKKIFRQFKNWKTHEDLSLWQKGIVYERISLKFTDQRHIEFLQTQFSVQNELQCFFRRFLFLATLLKILSKSREREKKQSSYRIRISKQNIPARGEHTAHEPKTIIMSRKRLYLHDRRKMCGAFDARVSLCNP